MSNLAKQYGAAYTVQKKAAAELAKAKKAVIANVTSQLMEIIAGLSTEYPHLKYVSDIHLADTSHPGYGPRLDPSTGAIYCHLWVNPYFQDFGLDRDVATAIYDKVLPVLEEMAQKIIDQQLLSGEWEFHSKYTIRGGFTESVRWIVVPK